MQINFENLTIGVFAKAAGVNVETIRFYQRALLQIVGGDKLIIPFC